MMINIKNNKFFLKIKPIILYFYNKLYNVYTIILIINDKINSYVKKKPRIMTIRESIDYIEKNKCSLSRFGDGEMKLINGNNIDFQPYSKEIQNRLKEVLSSNNINHIIAIPDVFGELNKYNTEAKCYWRKHLSFTRRKWYRMLDFNNKYANSFLSRCYMIYNDKSKSLEYFSAIKKIWDKKEIVIVEGNESRLGIGNDLFDNAKKIERILAPRKNAFNVYYELLEEVKKIDRNKTILLALGPTATILAYDLSKIGYQAIDIGHIDIEYEWFLKGADKKIKIENKYVGEAVGGTEVSDCTDLSYYNQIIATIKN